MPAYTVKDLPASERPRERLARDGAEALTDAELLAIVLRAGGTDRHVLALAHDILARFDLHRIGAASRTELMQFDGVGDVKAGQLQAVAELADRMHHPAGNREDRITCAEEAVAHLGEMRRFDEEHVALISLAPDNTVNATTLDLLTGAADEVAMPPRTIVREAVRHRAAAVILAHNHPSGDPTPSRNDIRATERVQEALSTVDIVLLDHIIIGDDWCSLKAEGYL
ncbi:MAG: DNA repair protein RadC [Candidatus Nanohaloarchaea archaeon]